MMTRLRTYVRAHRFGAWLTLIAIVGLLLRVVYAVALRHHIVGGDGGRYHFGALYLADGRGFINVFNEFVGLAPVVDTGHPPAWTVLLAGPTVLGLRTWLEHQLVASIVGTATIVMTGLAARRAFGARVGLIAAGLAAFYPFLWLYEREVVSEPLALLGVATVIWLAYKFMDTPGPGLAIGMGAVVGVLAMTKSDQLAIGVLLVAPVILSRRSIEVKRRVGWLAMAGAVCVVIMAPWSIYLSARFDRPVILSGAAGAAMVAGNCPYTYSGDRLGYWSISCNRQEVTGEDPIAADQELRDRAVDFISHHKSRFPVVAAARVGRMLGFYRPFQQMQLETERGSPKWVIELGFFAYWVLLPLAIAGAVIARRRRIPIYPLLVFPALAILSVILTIGAVRYRAPAEIPLVILAAVGIDAAVGALRRSNKSSAAP